MFNKKEKKIEVYGHRGARALVPENVIQGYKTSLKIGVDWVDMDIGVTNDRVVVVTHDIFLNPDIVRTHDGKFFAKSLEDFKKSVPPEKFDEFIKPYLIKNLTLKELQKYDVGKINPESPYSKYFPDQIAINGAYIPTLREVIQFVNETTKNQVSFQIEIKTDPSHPDWTFNPEEFAVELYKVLKEEDDIYRFEVQSFDWRCLYELQKINSKIKTSYLTSNISKLWTGGKLLEDYNNSIPQMIKSLGGFCWGPEDIELTKLSLDEAHKLGLKVVVWTWPEHIGTSFPTDIYIRLIDWGVDGIITDDPGRLNSLLEARGYILPKSFDVS
ncbi:MAG: glycerophosphodiester phosphodiesterase [Desulfobacterales bacterium]|nr:glycerophosphodiester phosphodiesterase [Desulfobacterales bacterium]